MHINTRIYTRQKGEWTSSRTLHISSRTLQSVYDVEPLQYFEWQMRYKCMCIHVCIHTLIQRSCWYVCTYMRRKGGSTSSRTFHTVYNVEPSQYFEWQVRYMHLWFQQANMPGYSTPQHTATHCNALQHTLQHTATRAVFRVASAVYALVVATSQYARVQHTATLCNMQQNTLQHTLQQSATHAWV